MTDSFFTSENSFDAQVRAKFGKIDAQEMIEAAVRRLVVLSGPVEAAERLYRLADICAGAYVLPEEFWHAAPCEDEPELEMVAPEPKRLLPRLASFVAHKMGAWMLH